MIIVFEGVDKFREASTDLESNIKQEFTTFRDKEEEIINQYKDTNNLKDALINVLEKSLNDKAREKYASLTQVRQGQPESR